MVGCGCWGRGGSVEDRSREGSGEVIAVDTGELEVGGRSVLLGWGTFRGQGDGPGISLAEEDVGCCGYGFAWCVCCDCVVAE